MEYILSVPEEIKSNVLFKKCVYLHETNIKSEEPFATGVSLKLQTGKTAELECNYYFWKYKKFRNMNSKNMGTWESHEPQTL